MEVKLLLLMNITLYIANRVFGGLRKFSAIYKHRQIVDLALINKKVKYKIQRFGSVQTRYVFRIFCPTCHILNVVGNAERTQINTTKLKNK